jgi:lipopolysaccharide/colanic/teichoic acid biosynthesis glycosyltransferase
MVRNYNFNIFTIITDIKVNEKFRKNKIKCLFINVNDISKKLFEGEKFNKKYQAIHYDSKKSEVDIQEYLKTHNVQKIIVEASNVNYISKKLTQTLVNSKINGIKVYEIHEFYEEVNQRVPLVKYDANQYLADEILSLGNNTGYFAFKRFIDLVTALVFIPFSLPLIAIGALFVFVTSPGNVFFIQTRVGKNSKPFNIYKLRTMKLFHDGGFTEEEDCRVLPVGKILRLTKIDELPQLLNILKGDMSLIGPRPERPEFVKIATEENAYFDLRHIVKPGVTGWAQVHLPKATPKDNLKKLEYDLYYIKNNSIILDCKTLIKTIKVVLTMNGN